MSDDPWERLKNSSGCRHLRSKEMFYDNGIPLEERGGSGIFWCGKTFHCLGPDGTTVDKEECGPTRMCYEQ
jgi:hypothetical protein